MKGTDNRWYEFKLVTSDRSRGFFQPKVGLNYNATQNLNIFANFSHVERFADLGVYYNYGRINEDAEDEKSNQFEFGLGWNSKLLTAKLNSYYMLWDNKSASIQDQSKAGEPGYDRNGFRTELIGTSKHMGLEFEIGYSLNTLLPLKGFGIKGMVTLMDNKWQSVLSSVLYDPITGKRRAFNTSSYDENGNIDTLFFDELEGTPVASGPQFMSSLSLTYDNYDFFGSIDASFFGKDYILDGGSYMGVKGDFVGVDSKNRDLFRTEFDNQLPTRILFDFNLGYNFYFGKQAPLKGTISGQILNIFDTDYLASADRYGVIPGMKRAFRLNLSVGF
jgi:outer membrane receptor protein involved in Fe transport